MKSLYHGIAQPEKLVKLECEELSTS